jgi:hypothetical protein
MTEDQGEQRGFAVLTAAGKQARAAWGDRLVAAFALGSLAHGGFAPEVSDVDLGVVLDENLPTDADHARSVREHVAAELDDPLADRLSVFWSDWPSLRANRPAGRFPAVDRLDLMDSGRLLFGTDQREKALRPTRSDLIADGAAFAADKLTPHYLSTVRAPEQLLERGPRDCTKVVLFPVRFLYTLRTGEIGHNEAAITWYAERNGAAEELVRAAQQWRHHGLSAEPHRDLALLREHLTPLHIEFLDAYLTAEDHYQPTTRDALRRIRTALTEEASPH